MTRCHGKDTKAPLRFGLGTLVNLYNGISRNRPQPGCVRPPFAPSPLQLRLYQGRRPTIAPTRHRLLASVHASAARHHVHRARHRSPPATLAGKCTMINSVLVLVVAMLSPARGWGLPSHNSPNETTTTGGVDGARDRRHLQSGPIRPKGEIRRCNGGWSALPTPRLAAVSSLTTPP